MLRVSQIKLPPGHGAEDILHKTAKALRIPPERILDWRIARRSVDARKKPEVFFVYAVDVTVEAQAQVLGHCRNANVQIVKEKPYAFVQTGTEIPAHRPVIIGTGPAGLFCGYLLAKHGYRPLLLERGRCVEERLRDVEKFWAGGALDPASNVQFGEGGAGTFSDGKLNTLVKDSCGRNREVLRIFVEAGAPEEILYDAKPHIGTDILCTVIANLRRQIIGWGGEVRFQSQVTEFVIEDGRIQGVVVNGSDRIDSGIVVCAVGHSARDTFEMLYRKAVPMEAKAFAVGLRIEHPRDMIDRLQYGQSDNRFLPPAAYKVTAETSSGRGVYSFCMCPGGYVVNASSEEGRLAVNGMSYSGRDAANSNSAMIVTVTPDDYGGSSPLSGIAFQRRLEENAYRIGGGAVPVETYGDFRRAVLTGRQARLCGGESDQAAGGVGPADAAAPAAASAIAGGYPDFQPMIKGAYRMAPVHEILPEELNEALVEGIDRIGQTVRGFADGGAYLSGVESRTSSPVRIPRDESGQSRIRGLYPCGEGAGYAGGITSAAMDGMAAAEKIAARYRPWTTDTE